jgi:hydroxymethylglutaryl-CoA synthase
MRSNQLQPWSLKRLALSPTRKPQIGNSPVKRAPKRSSPRWDLVGSGMGHYAMAIGMDTAQGKPGDALEYTAGAGGGAYILGPAEESLAVINASYSYVTDTPDFWRREYQKYPEHGMRFTGEPAYFKHITEAATHLMEAMGSTAKDYKWAVFHQPNVKISAARGGTTWFFCRTDRTRLARGIIGNTYAGAAMIGLTATLDIAQPGDRILVVSFGSGAGSDAFDITVTDKVTANKGSPRRRRNTLRAEQKLTTPRM